MSDREPIVPQEQSPDVRRFHIGDILSVAPGYLVSLRHFDGVFDILNFMVRESVFLHQAPRVRLECEPYLYQQFPWLKEAGEQLGREIENYPRDKRIANNVQCASWLMPLIAKYGEYHDVRRIPMDDHDVIDPIDEAVKKVGKDRVIPFSLDDDEPGVGGGYAYPNNPVQPPAPQPAPDGIAAALRSVEDAVREVAVEMTYLRNRRRITFNQFIMLETLFKCELSACPTVAAIRETAATWTAKLEALCSVAGEV